MKTDGVIKKIKSAPKLPGVYIFFQKGKPIYVGKANNLKSRLSNYLAEDNRVRASATRLAYKKLASGIEALIVESQLIKKLKPSFNILMRDDKSYFYVAISKERFPRIAVVHKNALAKTKQRYALIGPFTEGGALRVALRSMRRALPYCTCVRSHAGSCLNAQIGNCYGYCCESGSSASTEAVKTYKNNIRSIKDLLLGKQKLERFDFIRDQLAAFESVAAHREVVSEMASSNTGANPPFSRAECYDISHLNGREAVGGMTAWVRRGDAWEADKSMWRKFKIKTASRSDDPASIKEVIGRRLRHPEWPYPDVFIIDGGVAQYHAAKEVVDGFFQKAHRQEPIQVISFGKPKQEVYGYKDQPTPVSEMPRDLERLIMKAIHYTHNFAVRYHRVRRRMAFAASVIGK